MIYEHFRATSAYDAVQGLSDLFNIRLQNDNVQDSTYDGTKLYYQQVKLGQKWSWKDCTNQNYRILFYVFALYDQETTRNHGQPSYQSLKASVTLHIDQTMRTRNFRARSETVDRGAFSKSREGKKKPTLMGKWESDVVSPMIRYLQTGTRVRRERPTVFSSTRRKETHQKIRQQRSETLDRKEQIPLPK